MWPDEIRSIVSDFLDLFLPTCPRLVMFIFFSSLMPGWWNSETSFESAEFVNGNCQDASILYKYINPNLLAVASEDWTYGLGPVWNAETVKPMHWLPWFCQKNPKLESWWMWWYCWWFRNPKATHHRLDGAKTLQNKGINDLALNWWVYRISEPSSLK